MEESQNKYFVPQENADAEVARLGAQDRHITKITGLFPPQFTKTHIATMHRVLDIGSGPGEWCLHVGLEYPNLEVIGVDISAPIVTYAQAQAEIRELPNVTFQEMNALEPFPFADAEIDYINLRFSPGWIPRNSYSRFLHECWRVLRTGGYFTSTEGENPLIGISSPATAQGFKWVSLVLNKMGLAFGDGYTSIIPTHANYFRGIGLVDIERHVFLADASYGSEYYDSMKQSILILFQVLQPRIVQLLGVAEQDYLETFRRIQQEITQDDFACLCYLLSTTGKKPS